MILLQKHKALLNAVNKDNDRPSLTGVHITEEYAEAADGFVLLRVPLKGQFEETQFEDADYPVTPGAGDGNIGEVIIPGKTLKAAFKATPRKSSLPILKAVRITAKNEHLIVTATDLETATELVTTPIEGRFPLADSIIPPRKPHGETALWVGIAPKILGQLVKMAKDLEAGTIVFQFDLQKSGSSCYQSPIRVEFYDDEIGAVGVAMPKSLPKGITQKEKSE